MKLPYASRIMWHATPDSEPIELVRFKRQITQQDINFWTRDIIAHAFVEWTLAAKHCITSRPKIRHPVKESRGLKLKSFENAALEAVGILPVYKNE